MTKTIKRRPSGATKFYLACALIFVGVVLLFSAFWVPPCGIIHESILVAFGEILTFAGALVGIDYTYRYKLLQLKSGLRKIVRDEIVRETEEEEKSYEDSY